MGTDEAVGTGGVVVRTGRVAVSEGEIVKVGMTEAVGEGSSVAVAEGEVEAVGDGCRRSKV